MSLTDFIEKYFGKFLEKSRVRNPYTILDQKAHIPPTSNEVKTLILYLQAHGMDPIIVGYLAAIKHLKITDIDIQSRLYRPAFALEIYLSSYPPPPPKNWKINNDFHEMIAWISPENGCVLFFIKEEKLPSDILVFDIQKDLESIEMGYPVADVTTLFKMKLKSNNTFDLYQLMCLVRKFDLPKELNNMSLNKQEENNLDFLKRWKILRPK
jgi:hypothetical protein